MSLFPGSRALTLVLALAAPHAEAQAPAGAQDPALDNLVHASGYRTAEPGGLGAVVERGAGPLDLVLVSGFGLGASAFEGFAARNAERYRMLLLTLPGFEGTPAPPMPPAGTSYGDGTWTRAAIAAVIDLIEERQLARPVLVGHFVNGTQVAAGVALARPELVRALVLLAGSPRFEPLTESAGGWPRGLTLAKKVAMVDQFLAPRWFKTVTRATWVANNFTAADYSLDPGRGKTFAERANEPPLPVLIRYLCEFHASDVGPELDGLRLPILLLQPGFDAAQRADPARSYLQSYLEEPWLGRLEGRDDVEQTTLDGAGILVMEDRAREVDATIAGFLGRHAK
jgi:pimeloyl-ACP methyl ester carboxylesterase